MRNGSIILQTRENVKGVRFVVKKLGTDCAETGIHREVSGR